MNRRGKIAQKILIIEDDRDYANATRVLLAEAGYTVLEAYDGTQAWDLIQQETPDVTLLDGQIHGLSGIELLKRLKSESVGFPGQVIMVSGRISTSNIVNALFLGTDDYIIKPFAPDELLARVFAGIRTVGMTYDRLHLRQENELLHQKHKNCQKYHHFQQMRWIPA